MKRIHFSVDDAIGCFWWLTKNKHKISSIFDSQVFATAKTIHERYHISVYFYCMYTNGVITLEDISDKWQKEFQENSDWLKFGFHCYEPMSNYNAVTKQQIINEYKTVVSQLIRITGTKKNITDIIRLHYFSGNKEVISGLTDCGVKVFLCADDERISYGLPIDVNNEIRKNGYFIDDNMECCFVGTNIRIENISSIKDITGLYKNKKYIVVFTHEKRLMEEVIQERIIKLLDELLFRQGDGHGQ